MTHPEGSSDRGALLCLQVAELLMGVPAPVMYWEQGHEWVFGDPIRFQVGCRQSGMWAHKIEPRQGL